jgi:hypothetical protein
MADPSYKSKSQEYQTPKEIYKPILDFYKSKTRFYMDVCCTDLNIPASYYYKKDGLYSWKGLKVKDGDGLNSHWQADCFMNPPWNETGKWLKKAFFEVKERDCEVWSVLPGDRLNTGYSERYVGFQKLLNENDNWFIVTLAGKFNFYNPEVSPEVNQKNAENGGLNTPVFVLYIGKNAAEYAKRWHEEQPIKGIVLSGVN